MRNAVLFASCTHIITRTGGTATNDGKPESDCNPTVTKFAPVDSLKCKVLGRVKIGDSGFSVVCGEDAALDTTNVKSRVAQDNNVLSNSYSGRFSGRPYCIWIIAFRIS